MKKRTEVVQCGKSGRDGKNACLSPRHDAAFLESLKLKVGNVWVDHRADRSSGVRGATQLQHKQSTFNGSKEQTALKM